MPSPPSDLLFVAPSAIPSSFIPSLHYYHRCPTRTLPETPKRSRHIRATLSATPFDSAQASSIPVQVAPRTKISAPNPAPAISRTESDNTLFEVAIIGAGPAGLSLAAALCRRGISVCCLDGAIDAPWPNHYGVWRDEFEAVGLQDCATAVYPTTAVYAGGDKISLDRAYLRVDRIKLKERLVQRCVDGGVRLCKAFVTNLNHVSEYASEISYAPVSAMNGDSGGRGGENYEIVEKEGMIKARLVVDCTGHALRFTETQPNERFQAPWEQAAYGIEAEVEDHPYQVDQMLLMDFRDGHMNSERLRKISEERPTFLYVFPTSRKRAFFEETSVIAPKAVPFEELKERLYRRLEHDGVRVRKVLEEEFSLIPMGGSLPRQAQRVVGFGGAACLVHPATGYMVARTVRMADSVAGTIAEGLGGVGRNRKAMEISEEVWRVTWSLELRRQRDFLSFGAELLGVLDMDESRRFFDAFFALPQDLWAKFLGFGLNNAWDRIYFALYFFVIASWPIRISLLRGIVEIGRWRLIRSVLPLWMSAFDES